MIVGYVFANRTPLSLECQIKISFHMVNFTYMERSNPELSSSFLVKSQSSHYLYFTKFSEKWMKAISFNIKQAGKSRAHPGWGS